MEAEKMDLETITDLPQSRLSLLKRQDFFMHPMAGNTCEIIGNCVVLRGTRFVIQNQKDQINNYLSDVEEVHLDIKKFFGNLFIRVRSINEAPQLVQIHGERCDNHFPDSDCFLLTYHNTLSKIEAIKILCRTLRLEMCSF